MGLVSSKSPLERRNTVARRSQRRSIHSIKARVDKLFPDIKRFKGIEEDVNYKALYSEMEHLKHELMRKTKDLQPQIRNIFDNTLNRIEEAFRALESKLRENQDKARRKQQEIQEKAEKAEKKEKKKKEQLEPVKEDEDVEAEEIEEDQSKAEAEALEESTDKRKTVEVKFVEVIPDDVTRADVHSEHNNNIAANPEAKRKSILKMGVPVMPGAMMNEISARSTSINKQYKDETYTVTDGENIIAKVNDMIEQLQAIEYQIADFVGKKHGTQYNRIRDRLNHYLIELNLVNTNDDYAIEQLKICRNYVGSCLNFLDEKSIEDNVHNNAFFPANGQSPAIGSPPALGSPPPIGSPSPISSPPPIGSPLPPIGSPPPPPITSPPPSSPRSNSSLSPIDARLKLQKLAKTTAI